MKTSRVIIWTFVILGILLALTCIGGCTGDKSREAKVIEIEIERLKVAWIDEDLEFLECLIPFGERYRYAKVEALRASMCTAASSVIAKPGQDWMPPAPPGYVLDGKN